MLANLAMEERTCSIFKRMPSISEEYTTSSVMFSAIARSLLSKPSELNRP